MADNFLQFPLYATGFKKIDRVSWTEIRIKLRNMATRRVMLVVNAFMIEFLWALEIK